MKSKVTGGLTKHLFDAKILGRYDVSYYQCLETGFIQTEEPYWLDEAYSSAITKLDLGLAHRNEMLRERVIKVLNKHFDRDSVYLDYAGGYGLFTRMMRDKGYNFYHSDIYCQNLFAEHFDISELKADTKFELVTAFEVFEHMPDPIAEIEAITKYGDHIFFTTEIQPKQDLTSVADWWYFIPETGQHISLHTEKSLKYIAGLLGYNFYTDGQSNHLFTKKELTDNPFSVKRDPFLIRKMRKLVNKFDRKAVPEKESLLSKDFEYVKSKLD
ncbi:class I SAM-dependent methyltransferase [Pedobacter lusitanus]|uniref:class I SAM-dependent methyltransferase n=1 Tax=Pedobacter lusitanus TaxID=1503925 RepID=UPI000698EBB2|nr:class I SAM-dependent methyltransferase [Pedobacter lusitanus]